MKLMITFFTLLIWCFQCFGFEDDSSSVKAIALLFRHGDRAPLGKFPTDPNGNYSWPGGFGALSPKGAKQLFASGESKVQRYASLLQRDSNEKFDLLKLYVQSSSTQRCIDSAVHFLNGFLPTEWPHSLIKVLPKNRDEFLKVSGKPCPKYYGLFRSVLNPDDPEFTELIGDNRELIGYVGKKIGVDDAQLKTFYYLRDTFKVHMDNGLQIPDWAEEIYDSHLKPLGELVFRKWSNSGLMHVRSGSLLKDLVSRLNASAEGNRRNIFLYSTHDLTMSSLMVHLNIIDQTSEWPDYGATLAIELHENEKMEDDDYEVKVFYFGDYSVVDPVPVEMPGCNAPCSFRKFKILVKPKFTLSYDEECKM